MSSTKKYRVDGDLFAGHYTRKDSMPKRRNRKSRDPSKWLEMWALVRDDLGPRFGSYKLLCPNKAAMKRVQSAMQALNPGRKDNYAKDIKKLPDDRMVITASSPEITDRPDGRWWLWLSVVPKKSNE